MNAMVSIALATLLLLGGGAGVAAAQDDLPNQLLYPVKILTEDVRLMVNSDPGTEIEMLMEMSQERVREMIALSDEGLTPPNHVALRHEAHTRRALQIAGGLKGEALNEALTGIQTALQTQTRLMEGAQVKAMGEAQMVMAQTCLTIAKV